MKVEIEKEDIEKLITALERIALALEAANGAKMGEPVSIPINPTPYTPPYQPPYGGPTGPTGPPPYWPPDPFPITNPFWGYENFCIGITPPQLLSTTNSW